MKRVSIIILAAVLCLSMAACSPKEKSKYPTDNVYHPETDSHFMYTTVHECPMTEGPDGYYIKAADTVYFIDRETLQASPLCGKPNCKHQKELDPKKVIDCDAYIPYDSFSFLEFQNGHLYISVPDGLTNSSTEKYLILQMEPDGTKRKVVAELPKNTLNCIMHRGALYYSSNVYSETMEKKYGVFRCNLPDGKPELLFDGNFTDGRFSHLAAYGNYLYVLENGSKNGLSYSDLKCFDLATGNMKQLVPHPDAVSPSRVQFLNDHVFGSLYYWDTDGYTDEPVEEQYYEYFMADLDGSNLKKIQFPFDENDISRAVTSDGKNLWRYSIPFQPSDQPRILQKVDENGNMLAEYPDVSYDRLAEIFLGGESHLFIIDRTEEGVILRAIEKNPEDGILKSQNCLTIPSEEWMRTYEIDSADSHIGYSDRG